MSFYLYCMAYPIEALVASMLPPEEFGSYMAIGRNKTSRGKVVFLEVDKDLKSEHFDLDRGQRECHPTPEGTPKHSVYLSIYRVLERLPLSALKNLYLVTKDGRPLALEPQRIASETAHPRREGVYLYQELCPVRPQVVSTLDPLDFCKMITDLKSPIHLPKLLFARMKVGEDPSNLLAEASLPYNNLGHLQNCVHEVMKAGKASKTAERIADEFFYTAIMDGLYLAEPGAALYYPFPAEGDLKDKYYQWWRSAV